jgi:hypothetical protein
LDQHDILRKGHWLKLDRVVLLNLVDRLDGVVEHTNDGADQEQEDQSTEIENKSHGGVLVVVEAGEFDAADLTRVG